MWKNYIDIARSRNDANILKIKPDIYLNSVLDFNPEGFGLKRLIFDWDGTLSWGMNPPIPEIREYFDKLRQDYECVVLSNNTNRLNPYKRAKFIDHVKTTTGLEVIIGHPFKPNVKSVKIALNGTPPEHTAIIGDLIFTDLLAGWRAGLGLLVLVAPIDVSAEPWYMRHFVRPLEKQYKQKIGLIE